MDIPEKLRFINDLVDNVKTDIIKRVKDMPEDWDGHELRWYISEIFGEVVFGGFQDKRSKRYKAYRNYVITKGL